MSEQQDSKAIDWLSQLLKLQGLATTVSGSHEENQTGDASYWLTIDDASLSPEQVTSLLGEKGVSLDSIQYLANTVLNLGQAPDLQQSYTVELAGYRRRRQEELKAIAEEAAQKVLDTHEDFEIAGLSSAERRQMHNLMGDYSGLETFSRGREPDRRLVVHLRGQAPPDAGSVEGGVEGD